MHEVMGGRAGHAGHEGLQWQEGHGGTMGHGRPAGHGGYCGIANHAVLDGIEGASVAKGPQQGHECQRHERRVGGYQGHET